MLHAYGCGYSYYIVKWKQLLAILWEKVYQVDKLNIFHLKMWLEQYSGL